MNKLKGKIAEEDIGNTAIPRKLWIALANDQLKRRERYLGKRFAKPCSACIEILMCDGPIGLHLCRTLHEMQDDGLITGISRIPFPRLRRKYLPISRECLTAYGLLKPREK